MARKLCVFLCLALCCLLYCFTAYGKGADGNVKDLLQGFWAPHDYGTRIEIEGDRFMVLWRNRPVLITKYTVKKDKDSYKVLLKEKGLRYNGASSDYATVTGCFLKDGRMYLQKHFPITGPSDEILYKTTNGRYGNVTVITDEMLPRLSGLWKTVDGNYEMKIEKGMLTWRFKNYEWEKPDAIAVIRNKDEQDPNYFFIVNKDPAEEFVCKLLRFRHENGRLITQMLVFDATAPEMIFEKINKR